MIKCTHNIKFIILIILYINSIKYIDIFVFPIFRTLFILQNWSSVPIKQSHFFSPQTPSNPTFKFCLYEFGYSRYLIGPVVKNPPETWVQSLGGMKWHPTPLFLPGKSHGQRSLAGYNPWGFKMVRYDLVTKQQQIPHVSGIIQYLAFCNWVLLLSITSTGFILVVACVRASSLFKPEQCSMYCQESKNSKIMPPCQ